MRRIVLMLAVCLLPLLAGCPSSSTTGGGSAAKKPKDLIIGVWEVVDEKSKGTTEFKADGAVVLVETDGGKEMKADGKYKFLEEDVVEITIKPPIEGIPEMTKKLKVDVKPDDMTATTMDDKKEVTKFKKKK